MRLGMLSLCQRCLETQNLNQPDQVECQEDHKCAKCFGILQPLFLLSIVDGLKQQITGKYVGPRSVSFSISLPVALRVRELLLNSVFGADPQIWLKDLFKKHLFTVWNQHSSLPIVPEQDGDVRLAVELCLPEEFAIQEYGFFSKTILGICATGEGKRKKMGSNSSLDQLLAQPKTTQLLVERRDVIQTYLHEQQDDISCGFTIDCKSKSIFVAGHYNKWQRGISQTPWLIDGALKTQLSVASIVEEPLCAIFSFATTKFCSAGREDADVRMLGDGRPFFLELLDVCNLERVQYYKQHPKQLQLEYESLSKHLELVSAQNLAIVDGSKATNLLKEGEEQKEKTYRCLVWVQQPIDGEVLEQCIDSCPLLEIKQTTPVRVLQRRALMERKKKIYEMKAQLIDLHHFVLHLRTEAGTYIKEFVHGDFGRTRPSLGNLLWPACSDPPLCDILELDVLSVELPGWPPA